MGSDALDLGECQCCGTEPAVGVASVPGVPMSITWGAECLKRGATPLWVADSTVGMCCNPAAPSWSDMAEWFREQVVYVHGSYVRMDTLTLSTFACKHDPDDEMVQDGSCPMCWKGQEVGIVEARNA